jgi:hypothetical protein
MRGQIARFTAPVVASVVLVMALPTQALASAPWNAGCPNTPSSNVCIYRDWHWEGQFGHMGGDNLSYVGETFPSSTYPVDDGVSSNKNLYVSLDVKWPEHPNYGGAFLCTQSGTGFYYVGITWNDRISSHDVVGSC